MAVLCLQCRPPLLSLLPDPFNFSKNASPATKAKGLLKEVNNGRLAMIGIFGFLAEQKVPGAVPFGPKLPLYAGDVSVRESKPYSCVAFYACGSLNVWFANRIAVVAAFSRSWRRSRRTSMSSRSPQWRLHSSQEHTRRMVDYVECARGTGRQTVGRCCPRQPPHRLLLHVSPGRVDESFELRGFDRFAVLYTAGVHPGHGCTACFTINVRVQP